MTDFCQYQDPGRKPCGKPGRRLTLGDGLGGLLVRCLCREHSDWIEAPEAVAARPVGPGDRAVLQGIGVRW